MDTLVDAIDFINVDAMRMIERPLCAMTASSLKGTWKQRQWAGDAAADGWIEG